MQEYLASLLGELRIWSRRLGKRTVRTVFFGGGTPSLLPAKAIEGILEQTAKRFTLPNDAEISLEANPESALAEGWLFDARKAGANRLSLGVQSFNDKILRILGRPHDSRAAEAAYANARAAGFANLSLDFMWGLPGAARPQSQREWLEDLRKGAELKPEHISTYGLSLEAGSPLEAACAGGELILPGEDALGSMYLAGGDFLEESGYMQYEISNFARMGHACRHNLGYWQGEDYLGLGPAAVSTIDGRRWSNPSDIGEWRKMVARGKPGESAEEITGEIRLKERLMLSLRTCRGLDMKEWRALSGRSFLKDFKELVEALQNNGLASVRQGHFRLTRAGMLVSDAALALFFARLEAIAPAPGKANA